MSHSVSLSTSQSFQCRLFQSILHGRALRVTDIHLIFSFILPRLLLKVSGMSRFTFPTAFKSLSLAFLFLITAAVLPQVHGQQLPAPPHATGLRPPTPEEESWMDQNAVRAKQVFFNSLALERVNEDRANRGLFPLQTVAVALGREASIEPPGRDEGLRTIAEGEALPASVDNSKLPAFPPIRNQGGIGSCMSFASVYYSMTHMVGLSRGWNNKNDNNSTKFSPKWSYPMVNKGTDDGSWYVPTFEILLNHGAATWSIFSYSGNKNDPQSYRQWCTDPEIWRQAIPYRMSQVGEVTDLNTAGGMENLKRFLLNGYVLMFGTDVYGWVFASGGDDPRTTGDSVAIGKPVCYKVEAGQPSGHAMTVVGYNDDVWVDINKNGFVEQGERGALRIANSWGTDWRPDGVEDDSGFTWISYDALRTLSSVPGVNNADRTRRFDGAFWFNKVFWITAREPYAPKLMAEFTLSHARRSQVSVRVGSSAPGQTFIQNEWIPGVLRSQGGEFGFDGLVNSKPGTFVFDLTDVVSAGASRYFLEVKDDTAGSPAQLSNFRLLDATGNRLPANPTGVPASADGSTKLSFIDYSFNALKITSPDTAVARLNEPFSYLITTLPGANSYSADGLPTGLAINRTTGQVSGTPSRVGLFYVTLHASNGNSSGSLTLALTVESPPVPAPSITSATSASGTVGETFSYQVTASGNPFSYRINGEMPSGLEINENTGLVFGTPTEVGTFQATVEAVNNGGTGSRSLTITIRPTAAPVPVVTSERSVSVQSGNRFLYRITAQNSPTSFGAEGLPEGLEIDPQTGVISGVITLARQYVVTLRASNGSGTGYLTLVIEVLGDSSFGPSNDNFQNRISISGLNVSLEKSNINGSSETGEPLHAGFVASKSVWWSWTAPASGTVVVDTIGSSFDTLLAVYSGQNLSSLKPVASDDESGGNLTSKVAFQVAAGTVYQIAVDGYGGKEGTILFHLQMTAIAFIPLNDLFSSATTLASTNSSVRGATLSASAETGEPAHSDQPARHSVWWKFSNTSAGRIVLDTSGSDFDSVLAVYSGNNLGSLTKIASDDQSGGNNNAKLSFSSVLGATYFVAVDGHDNATGNVVLNVNYAGGLAPANDNFNNAALLVGAPSSAAADTRLASAESNEPHHADNPPEHSLWYQWFAPDSGVVTISTAGSDFDTVLAVYTGESLGLLTTIASNDDVAGTNTSRVTFAAVAGTFYRIAVDGYESAAGNLVLALTQSGAGPVNDLFSNRTPVSGAEFSLQGSSINATSEAGEPAHYQGKASQTVWWNWIAPVSGQATIRTTGSDFDTVLAIYTGESLASLKLVIANDDEGLDETSSVDFTVVAGVVYQIVVQGYDDATGQVQLSGKVSGSSVDEKVLYETDFSSFIEGLDKLAGNDGWVSSEAAGLGVNGIVNLEAFSQTGPGAYFGFNPPANSSAGIYRAVSYEPVADQHPLVTFSALISMVESANGLPDQFGVTFYNNLGAFLARLVFDASSLKIYRDGDTQTAFDTGKTFLLNTAYVLEVNINYSANTWSAKLGYVELFADAPFHTGFNELDLGSFGFEWYIVNPGFPGNGYLVFDTISLLARRVATQAPRITVEPADQTVVRGRTAVFAVEASGSGPLSYQWKLNGTNVPNATASSLTVLSAQPGNSGLYTVVVSNPLSQIPSRAARLTLTTLESPRFNQVQAVSRGLQLGIAGAVGQSWKLESSTNLLDWSEVRPLLNLNGTVQQLEDAPAKTGQRYYRVRVLE